MPTIQRGNPDITPAQKITFVEMLAKCANVTASAKAAGFNRRTASKLVADEAASWNALHAGFDVARIDQFGLICPTRTRALNSSIMAESVILVPLAPGT